MSNDIDIEHRLDEIEEKVDESYKILRIIKRKQTFDFWFSIVKILVFIGAFYSVYVFIEPIINQFKDMYISFQGLSGSVESNDWTKIIGDFIKQKTQQ
jgi:hypothetical protein